MLREGLRGKQGGEVLRAPSPIVGRPLPAARSGELLALCPPLHTHTPRQPLRGFSRQRKGERGAAAGLGLACDTGAGRGGGSAPGWMDVGERDSSQEWRGTAPSRRIWSSQCSPSWEGTRLNGLFIKVKINPIHLNTVKSGFLFYFFSK